ncbi:36782_t:CDS:2, partial [Gigaspora margarita]
MYEKNINIIDIEEEDLPTEQEAFKAAMQKHTTIPKLLKNLSLPHLKQRIIQYEANFFKDYIHNKVWKIMKPQLPLITKYNLELYQNFQCTSDGFTFDNIPKYNWSYIEFLSTKFELKKRQRVNIYLTGVVQMHNVDAKTFYIDQKVEEEDIDLEEEVARFNNWCYNTNDWSIEEITPVKISTNKPELLPAIVPVPLPANPVPPLLETP